MEESTEHKSPQSEEDKPKLTFVKDAYYRYTDIMFNWIKVLEPMHAQAITTLFSGPALLHPDHPLRVKGEKGLTLFIGYDRINKPRLLFSLKQVQYMQYYIHEMRLTTPSWIEYHNARAAFLAEEGEGGEAKAISPEMPSREEGQDDWVPIPETVCMWSDFVEIEPITMPTAPIMMKIYKQIQKDAKVAERHERNGVAPPKWDSKRFDAIIDNLTPGPGLRRGPMKVHEGSRRSKDRDEMPEGVGWGGFPLAKDEVEAAKMDEVPNPHILPTDAAVSQQADGIPPTDVEGGMEIKIGDDGKEEKDDFMAVSRDAAAAKFASKTDHSETADAPGGSPTESPSSEDYGMRYHYHCQQALICAAEGGYVNAHSGGVSKDDNEETESALPKEVGRSLFIALSVTRWEKDPKVILEVGWSAVYWQERLESGMQEGQSKFEEMRDCGHYKIQDHLLTKKNGEKKPDFRDMYLFGDSLPIALDKLKTTVRQKFKDLSHKAGRGPIYIITHVPEGEEVEFKDVGLAASSYDVELQPDSWQMPPYQCARGCESVFVINTAALFGAVEGVASKKEGDKMEQEVGRTSKSLQHTAMVMFGQDATRSPEKCGNAGNDAFYTLEVFLAIMTGPPLPTLREDYRESLLHPARPNNVLLPDQAQGVDKAESEEGASFVHTVSLTPPSDSDEGYTSTQSMAQTQQSSDDIIREVGVGGDLSYDDDDDDDDGDDIKGVYYEDEDGNLVEMGD
ncbi:hypothetical protein CI109_106450 [Kwoniella shandongensis]|uniref:Uncharacterized protein n=1 Tax=Kwoniella shandongensis TaxID=1734106 RepID=A0A5M6C5X7_9TREE|nr:uncharacterized protein CI109_002632 [Kwoniella shandongensis]KAA5528875.1 hypothetical protein CI109_002632 [Kwoniella shandongensis]